jgi:hypothetical protein
VKKWPDSQEAVVARGELEKLAVAEKASLADDLAELKSLPRPTSVAIGDVTIRSAGIKVGTRWYFDASPVGNRNATAEKGDTFASLDFDVRSTSKDPTLPCVVAYFRAPNSNVFEGGAQVQLAFRRWDSYSSQMGLEHDVGNDFKHADVVKFSGGSPVKDDMPRTKMTYFVALKIPTLERAETPHGDYPVTFSGKCTYETRTTWSTLKTSAVVIDWRAPGG